MRTKDLMGCLRLAGMADPYYDETPTSVYIGMPTVSSRRVMVSYEVPREYGDTTGTQPKQQPVNPQPVKPQPVKPQPVKPAPRYDPDLPPGIQCPKGLRKPTRDPMPTSSTHPQLKPAQLKAAQDSWRRDVEPKYQRQLREWQEACREYTSQMTLNEIRARRVKQDEEQRARDERQTLAPATGSEKTSMNRSGGLSFSQWLAQFHPEASIYGRA